MTALSVVIPVYNNWWLTARCLRELDRLRSLRRVAFETIVVDNASSDETWHAIADYPWVRYERFEENRNFAGACNAGARLAQVPITLLLNNDAYPIGDALTPLVEAFDRENVAIAGGALFFEDGVTQAAGLEVLRNAHWHYFFRNLPPQLDPVNRSRDAPGVSGAAMAVRTQWFVADGGFDESFVNGFEDVDLCLRARDQGYVVAYVANARFAHYEAASQGRFAREAENERRFYLRWGASMSTLPRTERGSVGAIAVRNAPHENRLLVAAREDLEGALRAFGHPLARGAIAPWRRLDRRFRNAATLSWFAEAVVPGVTIERRHGFPSIRTHGGVQLEVPFLPCAASDRIECVGVQRSADPSCSRVGVIGGAFDGAISLTPELLLGDARLELACVVHLGLSDDAAWGNVLIAQAGLPAIALSSPELRSLFAPDVAIFSDCGAVEEHIARMIREPETRRRYGELVAADARRRFTPRRSAIRVVDLLCAARFGLERPSLTVAHHNRRRPESES